MAHLDARRTHGLAALTVALLLAMTQISCGACARIERQWSSSVRDALTWVGLGTRTLAADEEHARLTLTGAAIEEISNSVLSQARFEVANEVISLEPGQHQRAGSVLVEVRPSGGSLELDPELGPGLVRLRVHFLVEARFDTVGRRRLWSYRGTAYASAPIARDGPRGDALALRIGQARLTAVEATPSWTDDEIAPSVQQEIAAALRRLMQRSLTNTRDVAILRLRPINLPFDSLRLSIRAVHVAAADQALVLSLTSNLRPQETAAAPRRALADVRSPHGPASYRLELHPGLVHGALQMQLALGFSADNVDHEGVPNPNGRYRVTLEREDTTTAGDGTQTWRAEFSLWCFELAPCHRRELAIARQLDTSEGYLALRASEGPPPRGQPLDLSTLSERTLRAVLSFVDPSPDERVTASLQPLTLQLDEDQWTLEGIVSLTLVP